MRSIFKLFNAGLPLIVVLLCCAANGIQGQTMRDVRVISARAGGVNFVSGDARVRFRDRNNWETLTAKVTLASGDTVATGADSQLEVLLNPGSYFRLGANSEFTLADDSLDSLRLSLTKGSGIIEATGFNELRVSILLDTPQTRLEIVRSGIYRIDVQQQPNSTGVAVHKGRMLVGKDRALTLKGGRTARIVGVGVEVAKLDKVDKDALDLWSRERAKLLAKANGKLSSRNVNTVLASMNMNNNWSSFSSGIWYFEPRFGCYLFIPGGYGWASPYGFHYNHNFFGPGRICNSCNSWWNDNREWGGAITGDGSNGGGGSRRNTSARDYPTQPSKESPDIRPAPALGKSPDKMNRDQ